jgi:hypothetical protein
VTQLLTRAHLAFWIQHAPAVPSWARSVRGVFRRTEIDDLMPTAHPRSPEAAKELRRTLWHLATAREAGELVFRLDELQQEGGYDGRRRTADCRKWFRRVMRERGKRIAGVVPSPA